MNGGFQFGNPPLYAMHLGMHIHSTKDAHIRMAKGGANAPYKVFITGAPSDINRQVQIDTNRTGNPNIAITKGMVELLKRKGLAP